MNCQHHVAWIIPVRNGLHQCFQCWEVVTRKDISPKFEDMPVEFQRRWEAHEKTGELAAPAAVPPAKPAAPALPGDSKAAPVTAPVASKPAPTGAPPPPKPAAPVPAATPAPPAGGGDTSS
jgi:hypothetical protein